MTSGELVKWSVRFTGPVEEMIEELQNYFLMVFNYELNCKTSALQFIKGNGVVERFDSYISGLRRWDADGSKTLLMAYTFAYFQFMNYIERGEDYHCELFECKKNIAYHKSNLTSKEFAEYEITIESVEGGWQS